MPWQKLWELWHFPVSTCIQMLLMHHFFFYQVYFLLIVSYYKYGKYTITRSSYALRVTQFILTENIRHNIT